MIKLVRVDHRLIHGQVAFSWTKSIGADCILCASNALVKDPLRMDAMRMAVPAGVKLVMKSIEDSVKAINSGVTDKYKLFILCESVEEMYDLVTKTDCIDYVNLGGAKKSEGRHELCRAVYVSDEDVAKLKDLMSKNITICAQLVPDDVETNVQKLLG